MAIIKTIEQYQWAVNRVEELLPLTTDQMPKDDPRCIELEILSNLVSEYSEENFSLDISESE